MALRYRINYLYRVGAHIYFTWNMGSFLRADDAQEEADRIAKGKGIVQAFVIDGDTDKAVYRTAVR
jgi:hypothetical protein